ncbi:hypothetical protein AJ85_19590 [Alkalihalobacillus alcalophilus ATCC 27647 = CGMCC 1.3604]|uniref:Uncharacterized protein n=1 Tax=Alkalihalobacillus alcalophilus ATCC 27647 = CGMCC 1.3604 TaxID=1218173 RepID=A0A094YR44_ALKAL|nr:hypothetical protein [Alkalihalobacillus alcalophilus]KGA95942.1 hypothetical protein BALCAV_0219205 [Alkalihalobacillus alcalophilus ATCC 27647 = CGMCC 1.3604]MED1561760.1 hypothetical protein [Alkalihalobacillus alcalophilus]THG89084.1 hypothetical protein AJ85_19590 [Alkalihalobacillus alcalophilus ATCC 27647 = CGMCC 1.3604]
MRVTYRNFLLLVLMVIFISGCTNLEPESSRELPEDFDFSLIYGTYGKQKIDTYNNTVIKDLVENGIVEADVTLTEDEMNRIYNEMVKIDIMSDLNLEGDKQCDVEPPSISEWKIQINNEINSIAYGNYCEHPEVILDLIELEDFIHEIVSSKDEYKALPDAKGFYE